MTPTGVIRRIDDLGRVVIPKEIRKKCRIKEGDPLEFGLDGTTICINKYDPSIDYHNRFQEILTYMKDDEEISSEKVVYIHRIFEAIEDIIKGEEAADEEQTSNSDYAPIVNKLT